MRLAGTWIAAAAVPLAAGLLWWGVSCASKLEPRGTGRPPSGPPATADTRVPEGTDSEAVRRLEARVRMLERRALDAPEKAAQTDKVEGASPRPPEREPESPLEEARKVARAYDDVLRGEAVDPAWSTAMQGRIDTFFRSDLAAGASVQRSECRSSVCRVEVSLESTTARERFAGGIGNMLPPHAVGYMHIDSDDPLKVVVYLGREGERPPRVEL